MDIGKAFGFVFEDERWVIKILLGAAITLIPLFGPLTLMGYAIAALRNVRDGHPRPLPEWTDLGAFFMDGIKLWVVNLVYAVPILVLLCPALAVWGLPLLGGDQQDFQGVFTGVAALVSACLGCIIILYAILLNILQPALQIRYAETGEIGACLRFVEVFRFAFANIGRIIVALLLIWAASAVIGLVIFGVSATIGIVPICGWILGALLTLLMLPVGVWVAAFSAHLYGQIARLAGAVTASVQ